MAAGSAIVCTRVGSCQEIAAHDRTGLLEPAKADAGLYLMSDLDMAQRRGAMRQIRWH